MLYYFFTGCQSQPPSLSSILQSNEIYFVCQPFHEADTFSLHHQQNPTFVVVMAKTSLVRTPNIINVPHDIAAMPSITFYAPFSFAQPISLKHFQNRGFPFFDAHCHSNIGRHRRSVIFVFFVSVFKDLTRADCVHRSDFSNLCTDGYYKLL